MATHREQVESLSSTIHSAYGMWGAGDLKDAVDTARRLDPPQGAPSAMSVLGSQYTTAAADTARVRQEVQAAGRQQLPAAWTGRVGEHAAEVVVAASDDLGRMSDAFSQAGSLLADLSDALSAAQALHSQAYAPLDHAYQLLDDITVGSMPDPVNWDDDKMHQAEASAKQGIDAMLQAAEKAEEAGHRTAAELNRLADEAKAGRIKGGDLSAADKLVLTDAAVPGGPADLNGILTANDAARAGQAMDRLSAGDRARMDALLAGAKSPQERAYLLKALAAGHSVDEVTAFDQQIHGHGDDPNWLADRLTPVRIDSYDTSNTSTNEQNLTYQGASWTQGPHPTCVASSTVTARAMVDPLYSLQLTTGGHPDDPAYDNPQAFSKRLLDEQNRVYDGGRSWTDDLFGTEGMSDDQSNDVANQEIGSHTGAGYHNVDLGSEDARRDALGPVEQAVDAGKPVPVSISGGGDAHQMMIIGHRGDMLQIYNPWGYTVWVSEDDFVQGHMNNALNGQYPEMKNTQSVRLPN